MRYWTKANSSVRIGIVSRPDMHHAAGPRLSIRVHPPVWIIGRGLHPTYRAIPNPRGHWEFVVVFLSRLGVRRMERN